MLDAAAGPSRPRCKQGTCSYLEAAGRTVRYDAPLWEHPRGGRMPSSNPGSCAGSLPSLRFRVGLRFPSASRHCSWRGLITDAQFASPPIRGALAGWGSSANSLTRTSPRSHSRAGLLYVCVLPSAVRLRRIAGVWCRPNEGAAASSIITPCRPSRSACGERFRCRGPVPGSGGSSASKLRSHPASSGPRPASRSCWRFRTDPRSG